MSQNRTREGLGGAFLRHHPGIMQLSLLTRRQHFLRLRLRWGLFIEQVGNIRPIGDVQTLGDPLQTHSRFLTNAARPQLIPEDILTLVPAIHHVTDRPRILNAQLARQQGPLPAHFGSANSKDTCLPGQRARGLAAC